MNNVIFHNRKDAGEKLGKALLKYKDKKDLVVLGIPRGGVELAYEVAKALNAKFSLIIVRKLPIPYNPEAGWGAIAEDGSTYYTEFKDEVSKEEQEEIIKAQSAELVRRVKVFRQGKKLLSLKNKTVIIVDDGLAIGSTVMAAIIMCKKQNPKKLIVAVPISGMQAKNLVEKHADEVVVLSVPPAFQAVAEGYEEWHDVTDEEALKFIKKTLRK